MFESDRDVKEHICTDKLNINNQILFQPIVITLSLRSDSGSISLINGSTPNAITILALSTIFSLTYFQTIFFMNFLFYSFD